MWAHAVAPIAEHVAKVLWSASTGARRSYRPPTLLTQAHRRAAKGAPPLTVPTPRRPPPVCRECGCELREGGAICRACHVADAPDRMRRLAAQGRIAAQRPAAQARRAKTQRRNRKAELAWSPSEQPEWLTERVYLEQIQPRLSGFSAARLASALGVSTPYAVDIRARRRRPHPRHWRRLAELTGVDESRASGA